MLYRKIGKTIEDHLRSASDKIMILDGARQVGKSFIIREVGKKLFPNFHEINFIDDDQGAKVFKDIRSIDDFYLVLSALYPGALGDFDDTLIFLDEIQHYPQYLTWLKFLRQQHRFRFIASGSRLGIALRQTTSIPIGSIVRKEMYQLDFEEFLIANGIEAQIIEAMRQAFVNRMPLPTALHNIIIPLCLRYLLVGGMPDAVNAYIDTRNIGQVRQVQTDIHDMYKIDASKYEDGANRKLSIMRIYDMIPSQMENKKKRLVAKEIKGKEGDRFDQYKEEFEYLISSGIAISANAIVNPKFPLAESSQKNLLKLYLNDVGLLTNVLYKNNITPVLNNERSVNLGAVYENFVAQELRTQGSGIYYYDQRKIGEVDFLINDYRRASVLPIEVKSGKDYEVHSALDRLMAVGDYGIKEAFVLCNTPGVEQKGGVWHMPIYYAMFLAQMVEGVAVTF